MTTRCSPASLGLWGPGGPGERSAVSTSVTRGLSPRGRPSPNLPFHEDARQTALGAGSTPPWPRLPKSRCNGLISKEALLPRPQGGGTSASLRGGPVRPLPSGADAQKCEEKTVPSTEPVSPSPPGPRARGGLHSDPRAFHPSPPPPPLPPQDSPPGPGSRWSRLASLRLERQVEAEPGKSQISASDVQVGLSKSPSGPHW